MYCQLKEIKVHYEMCGTGRPLICLHGAWPDHRMMMGCMEPVFQVRDGWQRIYPDLPGMGQTPGPNWLVGSDQMLDVILELIDALIPGQHFALAGLSYGAYLARGILGRKAELVDGILLVCPLVRANRAERTVPAHTIIVEDPELMASLSPEAREEFEAFMVVQSRRVWKRTRDEVNVGLSVADVPFLEKLQGQGYAFSLDADASYPAFEKPALLLMGRQDAVVGYRDAWELVEKFPRGTFAVLDRAGHNIQIEQEGLFNCLVAEWLDRVEENLAQAPGT